VVSASVALVPPRPSVLPPGAGNEEPKKALKPDQERAKKVEKGYGDGAVVHRQVHAATIRRDDDGDLPVIPTIEQVQPTLL
jgi:hypothetical protein